MQDFFFIRVNGKNIRIDYKDIRYVESRKNYVNIVTEHSRYLVLTTLKKMEGLLPDHSFCRIHKSYIVALAKITAFDSEQVYMHDKILPIGEHFKGRLERSVLVIESELSEHIFTHAVCSMPLLMHES